MSMKCVNKVILVGAVGADPNIGSTSDGREYASFSLATTEEWRDQEGTRNSRTEWHRIKVFYPALAETVRNYVRKGTKLYVEGKIRSDRTVDPATNLERQYYSIIADTIVLLGSRRDQGTETEGDRPDVVEASSGREAEPVESVAHGAVTKQETYGRVEAPSLQRAAQPQSSKTPAARTPPPAAPSRTPPARPSRPPVEEDDDLPF